MARVACGGGGDESYRPSSSYRRKSAFATCSRVLRALLIIGSRYPWALGGDGLFFGIYYRHSVGILLFARGRCVLQIFGSTKQV